MCAPAEMHALCRAGAVASYCRYCGTIICSKALRGQSWVEEFVKRSTTEAVHGDDPSNRHSVSIASAAPTRKSHAHTHLNAEAARFVDVHTCPCCTAVHIPSNHDAIHLQGTLQNACPEKYGIGHESDQYGSVYRALLCRWIILSALQPSTEPSSLSAQPTVRAQFARYSS
jgi:hypothetical protein